MRVQTHMVQPAIVKSKVTPQDISFIFKLLTNKINSPVGRNSLTNDYLLMYLVLIGTLPDTQTEKNTHLICTVIRDLKVYALK